MNEVTMTERQGQSSGKQRKSKEYTIFISHGFPFFCWEYSLGWHESGKSGMYPCIRFGVGNGSAGGDLRDQELHGIVQHPRFLDGKIFPLFQRKKIPDDFSRHKYGPGFQFLKIITVPVMPLRIMRFRIRLEDSLDFR